MDRLTDRHTDICNSRVAFATENNELDNLFLYPYFMIDFDFFCVIESLCFTYIYAIAKMQNQSVERSTRVSNISIFTLVFCFPIIMTNKN